MHKAILKECFDSLPPIKEYVSPAASDNIPAIDTYDAVNPLHLNKLSPFKTGITNLYSSQTPT